TSSPQAQLWFDRGLVWTYAFHHEEAVACFEKAVAVAPDCAMAHWGIAYALGPNSNKPWDAFDGDDLARTVERTHEAVERAHATAARVTPVEQALIGALRARYPRDRPVADCSVWNEPYADRMREVYRLAPDDPDVAALCADPQMNPTPWQLCDLRTGQPPKTRTMPRCAPPPGGTSPPGSCGTSAPETPPRAPAPWRPRPSSPRPSPPTPARTTPASSTCTSS